MTPELQATLIAGLVVGVGTFVLATLYIFFTKFAGMGGGIITGADYYYATRSQPRPMDAELAGRLKRSDFDINVELGRRYNLLLQKNPALAEKPGAGPKAYVPIFGIDKVEDTVVIEGGAILTMDKILDALKGPVSKQIP